MVKAEGGSSAGFGVVLRGLRIASGMTQEQVGRMLQVRRDPEDQHPRPVKGGTVSGWERGSPLGDFKGETRGSTIRQFEDVEAEMLRRVGASGRPLPPGYTEGDLVRAVVAVIDSRGARPTANPVQDDAALSPTPPRAVRPSRRRPLAAVLGAAVTGLLVGSIALAAIVAWDPDEKSSDKNPATDTKAVWPLRDEDFSDPVSGWHNGATDQRSTRYVDGEYQVIVKNAASGALGSPEWNDLPSDLRLRVDARKVGAPMGSFGLACRETDGVRYEGRIDVDRSWRLTRAGKPMAGGGSAAIRRDGFNRIELVCRGDGAGHSPVTIEMSVNGVHLGSFSDPDGLPSGRIGVVVASQDPGVEVRFDDFAVLPL